MVLHPLGPQGLRGWGLAPAVAGRRVVSAVRTFEPSVLGSLLLMRTFSSLPSLPWLGVDVQPHLTCSSGYLLANISKKKNLKAATLKPANHRR